MPFVKYLGDRIALALNYFKGKSNEDIKKISDNKSECGISPELWRIFSEISRERKRQEEKWGEQNHPMTRSIEAPGLFRILAEKKKYENQTNGSEGNAMWANILLEKVYEAFAETEPEKQREEMIQVAAVAVQIIECLKRRKEAGNGQHA